MRDRADALAELIGAALGRYYRLYEEVERTTASPKDDLVRLYALGRRDEAHNTLWELRHAERVLATVATARRDGRRQARVGIAAAARRGAA